MALFNYNDSIFDWFDLIFKASKFAIDKCKWFLLPLYGGPIYFLFHFFLSFFFSKSYCIVVLPNYSKVEAPNYNMFFSLIPKKWPQMNIVLQGCPFKVSFSDTWKVASNNYKTTWVAFLLSSPITSLNFFWSFDLWGIGTRKKYCFLRNTNLWQAKWLICLVDIIEKKYISIYKNVRNGRST